ncbi:kinase-like domain-containing protein [Obelidium mucronatum]|nr:kinase-like domain-containing protein [Obelidium mucronatum]
MFIRKLTEKLKKAPSPASKSRRDSSPPPLPSKSVATRGVVVANSNSDALRNKRVLALDDFHIDRTLGTGSFGRVHLVRLKASGGFYAMKVLHKQDVVRMKQVEHTVNERAILARLEYPFLVYMLGSMQDCSNLYFVLEFVQGGELFTFLRKSGRFRNNVALFYAAEVILAFEYLHNRHIIYRDLKPENLLIDSEGHIKITDFGFAKEVPDVTWTLCGTPAVDYWALGILIYEMIAGHPPFYDDDHFKLYEKILACKPKFPTHFDPNAKDLSWIGRPWRIVKFLLLICRPVDATGDASNFDSYPEDHEPYGVPGPDPHKDKFRDF